MAWGQHLIINARVAEQTAPLLKDADHIRRWIDETIVAIGMVKYGPFDIQHFANDNPMTGGYTATQAASSFGLQLIETSNICAHFAENENSLFADIFSCKAFSDEAALDVFKRFWIPFMTPEAILDTQTLERGFWIGRKTTPQVSPALRIEPLQA